MAVLGSLPLRDGDLWWQMAYGRYMVENGTIIPDHTIFSWRQSDGSFIYCSWIPQILLYLLYQVGDLPILYAFRYLSFLFFIAVVFWYARKQRLVRHPLTWLITLLGFLMAYDSAGVIKPVIFSYVYFSLIIGVWIWVKTKGDEAWKALYLLPILILIWVNSHGTIVFGVSLILLIWVGETMNSLYSPKAALSPRLMRHLFVVSVLCGIAVLLTPYHWDFWKQQVELMILKLRMNELNTVADYRDIFSAIGQERNYLLILITSMVILIPLAVRRFLKTRTDWALLLVYFFFIALYLRFLRATYFLGPIFVFCSLYILSREESVLFRSNSRYRAVLGILTVILSLFLLGSETYTRLANKKINSWLGFGVNYLNPVEEAEFIAANIPNVKLGNDYVTGGYLIWRNYPETKIMIDPRYFPFMAWYAQYNQAFWGSEDKLSAFVDSVKCDAWCISLRFTKVLEWFRKRPEWKLLNYGPCAATFARRDLSVTVSSPLGNAGIADIVVPGYAVVVLNFATNNSDLEGAVSIVKGMRENFGDSNQVRGAGDYLNGFFSYFLRDYESVTALLNSARESRVIWSNTILVNSYQLQAAADWNQQGDKEAFDAIKAALEVNPNNMISVYNAGVIGWHLQESDIRSQKVRCIAEDRNLMAGSGGGVLRNSLKKCGGRINFPNARSALPRPFSAGNIISAPPHGAAGAKPKSQRSDPKA